MKLLEIAHSPMNLLISFTVKLNIWIFFSFFFAKCGNSGVLGVCSWGWSEEPPQPLLTPPTSFVPTLRKQKTTNRDGKPPVSPLGDPHKSLHNSNKTIKCDEWRNATICSSSHRPWNHKFGSFASLISPNLVSPFYYSINCPPRPPKPLQILYIHFELLDSNYW